MNSKTWPLHRKLSVLPPSRIAVFILALAATAVVGEKEPDLDKPEIRTKILGEATLQETLEERGAKGEELFYQPDSETPYTGWAKAEYSEGEPTLMHYKGGKQDGPEVSWYEDGQKSAEGHYTEGKQEGLAREWYEDGRKLQESHWADGKITTATTWLPNGERCPTTRIENGTGLVVGYHLNGKKEMEVPFKDGKVEGLWTLWDEDGKKEEQSTYKTGKVEGLVTWWYENGKKGAQTTYKDGKADGPWIGWHENGKKGWEGHYMDGKEHGLATWWRQDGTVWKEGHYKDGKEHGLVTEWYANGKKSKEVHYKDGKEHGLWTGWHENGTKSSEAHYKDGEPDGLSIQWHENGTKWKEIHFKDGEQDGPFTEWHENGKKFRAIHFKDGERDGQYTEWHENGQKSRVLHFKEGTPDGPYTKWHDNGTKAEEVHFKDGEAEGPFILWHENGEKREEGTFKDGGQEGPYTAWHDNGKKAAQGQYKNWKMEGRATQWHENGEKSHEVTYKDGERDGRYTKWHENGTTAKEVTFKNGKLEGPYSKWNENGVKMEEGTFSTAPAPVTATLVRPDSEWRWLHPVDGVDPKENAPDFHTTFFTAQFDDESWKRGTDSAGPTGGFGYGDDWFKGVDIGTPEGKTNASGQAVRYGAYFRHRFTTTKAHANLELRCQRDDGVIIYLDGVEVARDNVRNGAEAYGLPAAGPVGGNGEKTTHRIPLGDLTLLAGEHLLAISLHNFAAPSADLRIGGITLVELSAKVKAPGKKDYPTAPPIPNEEEVASFLSLQEDVQFEEEARLQRAYLQASDEIDDLDSYPEALAAVRRLQPGFMRAQLLMEVSDYMRDEGDIEQANSILDEALEQARLERDSGGRATTLALLSDEFREHGNKASAAKALAEARSALDDIKRINTWTELRAVIAVAESYASAGDLRAEKEVMSRTEDAPTGLAQLALGPPVPPTTIKPAEQKEPDLVPDLDGEAAGDSSGRSVSLSADGSRLAVGAPGNDGTGHVRFYQWNGTTSAWVQLGADLDGEAADDGSGWSVSLSSDGSRVAVGAWGNDGTGDDAGHVRVYQWNGTTSAWGQLGADLDGEAPGDRSGRSVSLSADGSRVAVGAPYNGGTGDSSGHVRVYQWNGTTSAWDQLGADLDGEAASDSSGSSVSLSADGSRVAVGAPYNGGHGRDAGHVRVYQWNGTTSAWDQLGADLDGEATYDTSGSSVSLSTDGSRVAVGADRNDGTGPYDAGHVRVYQWNGTTSAWDQLGTDLDGEAARDRSGTSVTLSADGSRLAVGAAEYDRNYAQTEAGHVRVYQWNGTTSAWVQLGADLDGEAVGDRSGTSVALSADGSRLAVGAIGNDGAGRYAGHVRIYQWNGTTSAWDRLEPAEKEGYRVGIPIPGKPGFVFNPFTNNPVDVRGVPPGTLVRDPEDPNPDHKFRVP